MRASDGMEKKASPDSSEAVQVPPYKSDGARAWPSAGSGATHSCSVCRCASKPRTQMCRHPANALKLALLGIKMQDATGLLLALDASLPAQLLLQHRATFFKGQWQTPARCSNACARAGIRAGNADPTTIAPGRRADETTTARPRAPAIAEFSAVRPDWPMVGLTYRYLRAITRNSFPCAGCAPSVNDRHFMTRRGQMPGARGTQHADLHALILVFSPEYARPGAPRKRGKTLRPAPLPPNSRPGKAGKITSRQPLSGVAHQDPGYPASRCRRV